jgi:hypothetical protein
MPADGKKASRGNGGRVGSCARSERVARSALDGGFEDAMIPSQCVPLRLRPQKVPKLSESTFIRIAQGDTETLLAQSG